MHARRPGVLKHRPETSSRVTENTLIKLTNLRITTRNSGQNNTNNYTKTLESK